MDTTRTTNLVPNTFSLFIRRHSTKCICNLASVFPPPMLPMLRKCVCLCVCVIFFISETFQLDLYLASRESCAYDGCLAPLLSELHYQTIHASLAAITSCLAA